MREHENTGPAEGGRTDELVEDDLDQLIAWAQTLDAAVLRAVPVEVAQRPTDPAKRAELKQRLKDLRAHLSQAESESGVLTTLMGGSSTLTPKGAKGGNAHNPGGGTREGGESGGAEGGDGDPPGGSSHMEWDT